MDDVHMLEKATNTHKHTRGDEIRRKLRKSGEERSVSGLVVHQG
jgi:hypothetical protein